MSEPADLAQPLSCSNPYTLSRTSYKFKPAWDVKVGVTRYDVWNAEDQDVTLDNVMYRVLPEWFERAPFFTTLDLYGTWRVAHDRQKVTDREIDYAFSRGIDFYAFLYVRFTTRDYVTGDYRPYDTLGNLQPHWRNAYAFDLYRNSTRCNRPKFSLIVQPSIIRGYVQDWNFVVSKEKAWSNVVRDLTEQYTSASAHVHRTKDGRPILFFYDGFEWRDVWGGDAALAKLRLNDIRERFARAGLGSAYIVSLDGYPAEGVRDVGELGFDAVSSYASQPKHADGAVGFSEYPYADARFGSEWYRNELKSKNLPMIPPVTTGWDPRPYLPFGRPPGDWFSRATPQEIVTQLNDAIAFVLANPQLTVANSVLVYAWNELAEGGYLVPTLAHGSERLDAIAASRDIVLPTQVPSVAPVVRPTITEIWPACDDMYGMYIEGRDFDPDAYIETRPAAIVGDDEIFARYESPEEWFGALIQCFSTAEERAAYDAGGVRVTLVNPSRPSASRSYLIGRQYY